MRLAPVSDWARFRRRGWNAFLRLRHGLRLFAESVSPEVPNDLFVAHLAVYDLFARHTAGVRVLDLGCGTGYGSRHLVERGARKVIGVDADAAAIRYARRRFAAPGSGFVVRFVVADAERLPDDLGRFDAVVSSNVLEHLEDPGLAVNRVVGHLEPGGVFLVAVPPIVDAATLAENERNPFHVSNLHVDGWYALLSERFAAVACWRQETAAGIAPDFADPFPSRLTVDDFGFEEVTLAELGARPAIGVVFACREPRR